MSTGLRYCTEGLAVATHIHTNFVNNTLGCMYNYVEYYCLLEDATLTCSHTHTRKYIQCTAVVRCTLQLSEMCVFLIEFYVINDSVTRQNCILSAIDEGINMEDGIVLREENQNTHRKTVPVTLCPPQIPHGLE
jgi:hypothetical protein